MQLEIGSGASPFEHLDAQVVLEICQRYAWAIPEPAAGVVIGAGANIGAAAQLIYIGTPVSALEGADRHRGGGLFQDQPGRRRHGDDNFAGRDAYANAISINGNSAGTAGQATLLQGGGGSGWIIASADF